MKLLVVLILALTKLAECGQHSAVSASESDLQDEELIAILNDTLSKVDPGTRHLVMDLASQGYSQFGVPQQPQIQPQPYPPQPPYYPQPQPYDHPHGQSNYYPSPSRGRSSGSSNLFFLLLLIQLFSRLFATTAAPVVTVAPPVVTVTVPFQGWIAYGGCRHRAFKTAVTANAAAAACTAFGGGSMIATTNMKTDTNRVGLLTILGCTTSDEVWTGITDTDGAPNGNANFADSTPYTPSIMDVFLGTTTPACGLYSISFTGTKIKFTNCDVATKFYICEVCP